MSMSMRDARREMHDGTYGQALADLLTRQSAARLDYRLAAYGPDRGAGRRDRWTRYARTTTLAKFTEAFRLPR